MTKIFPRICQSCGVEIQINEGPFLKDIHDTCFKCFSTATPYEIRWPFYSCVLCKKSIPCKDKAFLFGNRWVCSDCRKKELSKFENLNRRPQNQSISRTVFETGAERDIEPNRGRFDLISPFALVRLAKVYEAGAKKYADRNWEKGIPISRLLDSAKRHLTKYEMGKTDEDHLTMAIWNLFSILHFEEQNSQGLGFDTLFDTPNYKLRFKKGKEENEMGE